MYHNALKFIVNELVYNGHLQSLGAASIVYVASVILEYPLRINIFVIAYLIFQTIYFHDRYQGYHNDKITNQERSNHLKKYYHKFPLLIAVFFMITTLVLINFANYPVLIFSAIVIVFGVLYPLFFKDVTKYIPLFKNFYVSSVFALFVFFPSIYWNGELILSVRALILFLFIMIESMIFQFILDIKDKKSDKQRGLQTLSVLLSSDTLMKVVWTMNFLVLFSAIASLFIWPSYKLLALLAIVTFPLNGYMFLEIMRNKRRGYIFAAGQYLLWPLILVVLLND